LELFRVVFKAGPEASVIPVSIASPVPTAPPVVYFLL